MWVSFLTGYRNVYSGPLVINLLLHLPELDKDELVQIFSQYIVTLAVETLPDIIFNAIFSKIGSLFIWLDVNGMCAVGDRFSLDIETLAVESRYYYYLSLFFPNLFLTIITYVTMSFTLPKIFRANPEGVQRSFLVDHVLWGCMRTEKYYQRSFVNPPTILETTTAGEVN